jgi:hypothetical protein
LHRFVVDVDFHRFVLSGSIDFYPNVTEPVVVPATIFMVQDVERTLTRSLGASTIDT